MRLLTNISCAPAAEVAKRFAKMQQNYDKNKIRKSFELLISNSILSTEVSSWSHPFLRVPVLKNSTGCRVPIKTQHVFKSMKQ